MHSHAGSAHDNKHISGSYLPSDCQVLCWQLKLFLFYSTKTRTHTHSHSQTLITLHMYWLLPAWVNCLTITRYCKYQVHNTEAMQSEVLNTDRDLRSKFRNTRHKSLKFTITDWIRNLSWQGAPTMSGRWTHKLDWLLSVDH